MSLLDNLPELLGFLGAPDRLGSHLSLLLPRDVAKMGDCGLEHLQQTDHLLR